MTTQDVLAIQKRFDLETRVFAASSLITALLDICSTKAEKANLAVKILGCDPRVEDSNAIADFSL